MKKKATSPFRALSGIFDRIFGLLGALVLSQFPQFYGQYVQRLGGHLKEAERVLERYISASRSLGLTLQEYIDHHLVSQERIYSTSGEVMGELVDRYYFLERSFKTLQQANPVNRWLIFIQEVDWLIVQDTWKDFTPGVPTTAEGISYALIGLLFGWGIYSLIRSIIKRLFFRKRTHFQY